MKVVLKKVDIDDLAVLRYLAIETFRETFAYANTQEQIQEYFDQAYALDTLAQEIKNPDSDYILAEVDDQPAGFLKINTGLAQTEQDLENALEIQRIYVLQAYQGKGIGKRLFEYALEQAKKQGKTWAWLGVWEKNFKAQEFYAKYGFEKFGEHAFPVSEDKIDQDWLLKKKLS